jgi:hypothetical protein
MGKAAGKKICILSRDGLACRVSEEERRVADAPVGKQRVRRKWGTARLAFCLLDLPSAAHVVGVGKWVVTRSASGERQIEKKKRKRPRILFRMALFWNISLRMRMLLRAGRAQKRVLGFFIGNTATSKEAYQATMTVANCSPVSRGWGALSAICWEQHGE